MASTPAAKGPMRVAMTLDIKPGMVRPRRLADGVETVRPRSPIVLSLPRLPWPQRLLCFLVLTFVAAALVSCIVAVLRRGCHPHQPQLAEYKAHHDNSWPEIESALRSVGMHNLSLWAYGERMFYYAEYVGDVPFDQAYVVSARWGWLNALEWSLLPFCRGSNCLWRALPSHPCSAPRIRGSRGCCGGASVAIALSSLFSSCFCPCHSRPTSFLPPLFPYSMRWHIPLFNSLLVYGGSMATYASMPRVAEWEALMHKYQQRIPAATGAAADTAADDVWWRPCEQVYHLD